MVAIYGLFGAARLALGQSDVHPASQAATQLAIEHVKATFPSASIAFVVSLDRQPVNAATDESGITLLLDEEGPGRLRLSSTGEVQWQHDVEPGNHADSSIAEENTLLDRTRISPDGQFTYRVKQKGNEIVLRRPSGGNRRVRIPPPASNEEEDLTVEFVDSTRILVSGISSGGRRSGLLDLRRSTALWTELQFPADARPTGDGDFQAAMGRGGELICLDHPDSGVFNAYAFNADGSFLWSQKMSGRSCIRHGQWVIAASDQDLIALIDSCGIDIFDTRTGRLLGTHGISADLALVFEGSFDNHRLAFVGQSYVRNRPFLIQVSIDPDGKIRSLQETETLMRGIRASALSCIIMKEPNRESWIVTGFRK